MDKQRFLSIQPGNNMLEQERALFGCTHAEAGAWFTAGNNMPEEIVSTIEFHHHPSQAKDYRDIVSIISLAEAISVRYSRNKANDGKWLDEHDILLMEYALTDDDLLFVGERFCAARHDLDLFFA
jgi:HD-like signal output (HDOD) protein